MEQQYILCPSCKISVGFLSCCTCHKKFELVLCNGLQVNCPLCIDVICIYHSSVNWIPFTKVIKTYSNINNAIEIQKGCFIIVSVAMATFASVCMILSQIFRERQLKRQVTLNPCPFSKNR